MYSAGLPPRLQLPTSLVQLTTLLPDPHCSVQLAGATPPVTPLSSSLERLRMLMILMVYRTGCMCVNVFYLIATADIRIRYHRS